MHRVRCACFYAVAAAEFWMHSREKLSKFKLTILQKSCTLTWIEYVHIRSIRLRIIEMANCKLQDSL